MATKTKAQQDPRTELDLQSAYEIHRFDELLSAARDQATTEVGQLYDKVLAAIEKHPAAKGFHEYTITLVAGIMTQEMIAAAKYQQEINK